MLHAFALHSETNHLALLRDDSEGRPWIELRTLDGNPLGKIVAELLPLNPRWSPDGTTLAFGSNDGKIYLYRLGAPASEPLVAEPSLQAGFCEWAADGKRLAYSAYSRGDHTPPNIFTVDMASRQITQLTQGSRSVDRFPQWAPSGRLVAFQRQDLDEAAVPPRTHIVDVPSGDCRPLAKASEGESRVGRQGWSADSTALLVTEPREGSTRARLIRLQDGATLWQHDSATLQGAAFAPQGDRLLCICSDALLLFAYPDGALLERLSLAALSPVRASLTGPRIAFDAEVRNVYFLGVNHRLYRWEIGGSVTVVAEGEPSERARPAYSHEAYTIPSRDGRAIPVRRFVPPESRRAAILYVHGGPGGAIDPDDPFMLRLLAEGVEFLCVAYRGSSGYGRDHEEANREEYGRADVWDVVAAALDWKARVGEERPLVLVGYSYGAYLSFLALAQEERSWAGAIVMYPVSGMHRMGLHEHRAFPTEPKERAEAMIERSPLAQAHRIRGPLLILHGALDSTATTEELAAIRDAILSHGGECELVVFPDDTHGLRRHRDEIHALTVAFVERFE